MAQLAHGPFLVSEDGFLTPLRQPALRFAWRGRGCEATFDECSVTLAAQAGAVPFTVEMPSARPGALAAIGTLPQDLPKGWRLRLLADHRIRLETDIPLTGDATATALLRAMVGFALALDPYLDRLESAGVGAGVGAGTVKT
jgi:hypothetical protein